MKRITRDRHLTPEEAARNEEVRNLVDKELPELIERHRERMIIKNEQAEIESIQRMVEAKEEDAYERGKQDERARWEQALRVTEAYAEPHVITYATQFNYGTPIRWQDAAYDGYKAAINRLKKEI